MDLNYEARHDGFTLMCIMPLKADSRREREQEESVRAMATNTTVAHHRKSNTCVLTLDFTFKRVINFLKCLKFDFLVG